MRSPVLERGSSTLSSNPNVLDSLLVIPPAVGGRFELPIEAIYHHDRTFYTCRTHLGVRLAPSNASAHNHALVISHTLVTVQRELFAFSCDPECVHTLDT